LYYEALLFSQEGGLQQIYCYTKKENANQISERVLNSVELKQATNNGKITFLNPEFFWLFLLIPVAIVWLMQKRTINQQL
jgi:hypothetical protein